MSKNCNFYSGYIYSVLISKHIQLQCFQNMDHPKYAAVLMNGNKWCGSRAKQPLAIPSKVFEFSVGQALTNALVTITHVNHFAITYMSSSGGSKSYRVEPRIRELCHAGMLQGLKIWGDEQ